MVTVLLMCLAPSCWIAPAVPAYGYRPPSSRSCPTVSSQPGRTFAARPGDTQHSLSINSNQYNQSVAELSLSNKLTRSHCSWGFPRRINIFRTTNNHNSTATYQPVKQSDQKPMF